MTHEINDLIKPFTKTIKAVVTIAAISSIPIAHYAGIVRTIPSQIRSLLGHEFLIYVIFDMSTRLIAIAFAIRMGSFVIETAKSNINRQKSRRKRSTNFINYRLIIFQSFPIMIYITILMYLYDFLKSYIEHSSTYLIALSILLPISIFTMMILLKLVDDLRAENSEKVWPSLKSINSKYIISNIGFIVASIYISMFALSATLGAARSSHLENQPPSNISTLKADRTVRIFHASQIGIIIYNEAEQYEFISLSNIKSIVHPKIRHKSALDRITDPW